MSSVVALERPSNGWSTRGVPSFSNFVAPFLETTESSLPWHGGTPTTSWRLGVSIVYAVEALFLRLSIVLFYDEVQSFRHNYGKLYSSKFRGDTYSAWLYTSGLSLSKAQRSIEAVDFYVP
jgi:hypothetical protein